MYVYDYKLYEGLKWCTGWDVVSKNIINGGIWDKKGSEIITDLLEKESREGGIVLDFGSHIGWYSILCAKMGFDVWAFDESEENCKILRKNAKLNKVSDKIKIIHEHVGKDFSIRVNKPVLLVKADVEGAEPYVVNALKDSLIQKAIKYLYLEVTPAFNEGYETMVQNLDNCGYLVLDMDDPFDFNYDFAQKNLLFKRL